MRLIQSFEEKRDLLTQIDYKRGNTLVIRRVYTYDVLGCPLTRQTSRNGQTVNDSFVHTYRSELASAQVNGQTYAYDYDNIGNRRMSIDASDYAFYDANELNQYSSIRKNEDPAFVPTFDAAGNQTLVRTTTGTWSVTYNAENRPIIFQKTTDSETTRITCSYDYMGRRAMKKVEEITTDAEGNESITVISNHRFIYRGYLQIGCCDLTRANHPCLWLITWDPTQTVATRPLAIQKDGTWYTYGWDLTKNICEVFGPSGYIRTTYTYTPFGNVITTGDVEQPIQWSSEYYDSELALVYYNYRHYNPTDGRWINRDPIAEQGGWNLYGFVGNSVINLVDKYGLFEAINISLNEVPWSVLKEGEPFPIKKTQKFQETSDAVAVENIQVAFEPKSIKTPDGDLWGLKPKITYKFAICHREDIKPDDSLPTISLYNTYKKHEIHHIEIYIKWYNKYYERFHNVSKAQFCRKKCAIMLKFFLMSMYNMYNHYSYIENYRFDVIENQQMNKPNSEDRYKNLIDKEKNSIQYYTKYAKGYVKTFVDTYKCIDKISSMMLLNENDYKIL